MAGGEAAFFNFFEFGLRQTAFYESLGAAAAEPAPRFRVYRLRYFAF